MGIRGWWRCKGACSRLAGYSSMGPGPGGEVMEGGPTAGASFNSAHCAPPARRYVRNQRIQHSLPSCLLFKIQKLTLSLWPILPSCSTSKMMRFEQFFGCQHDLATGQRIALRPLSPPQRRLWQVIPAVRTALLPEFQ